MIVIRKGVFETNSSSTHAICVAKTDKINIPEKIEVNLKDYEFGWECDKRDSVDEKIAYLLIGILNYKSLNKASKQINQLIMMLTDIGVKDIRISGIEIHSYGSTKEPYFDTWDGYIDHGNELGFFIETLLGNSKLLEQYLFNSDSFILTGNDNDDDDVSINVNYEYEGFFKGN